MHVRIGHELKEIRDYSWQFVGLSLTTGITLQWHQLQNECSSYWSCSILTLQLKYIARRKLLRKRTWEATALTLWLEKVASSPLTTSPTRSYTDWSWLCSWICHICYHILDWLTCTWRVVTLRRLFLSCLSRILPNELRVPTNSESITIQLRSLRRHWDFVTNQLSYAFL